MTKLVRDLMHKGLITCPPDIPLGQVAARMAEHHVHALVVTDPTGKPVGLISDFDLLTGEWLSTDEENLASMKRLTAGKLMTSPIDTIEADAPWQESARIMLEKQDHRLVVTEHGEAVGIISITDIVAAISTQMKAARETVGDVMSYLFLVCRDKTPIIAAARTMSHTHWRSVIVIDTNGKPLGIVTGQDLLWHVDQNGVYENLNVEDIMSHPLTTCDIHASLHDAANLMIQKRQHRLVVVDKNEPNGFPLGLISSFDIVAEMARPGSVWQG
jgi:CBS domain-containing protein